MHQSILSIKETRWKLSCLFDVSGKKYKALHIWKYLFFFTGNNKQFVEFLLNVAFPSCPFKHKAFKHHFN